MKNQKNLIAIACFCLLTFTSYCSTLTWIGGVGNWNDHSNWDSGTIPTFNDIVIIEDGVVTVSKPGFANKIEVEGGELLVLGTLTIHLDQPSIPTSLEALTVDGDALFYNNGLLQIEGFGNPTFSRLVLILGDFENDVNGEIYLNGAAYTGIHNFTSGTFVNRGSIEIENIDRGLSLIRAFYNYGSIEIEADDMSILISDLFYNSSSAEVFVNQFISIQPNGLMNNYGEVNILGTSSAFWGIDIFGKWTSQVNSDLHISGTFDSGIFMRDGCEFRNKGSLIIESEELYTLAMSGTGGFFVNHQKGSIVTQTSYGVVINGSCLNYGNWQMLNPSVGALWSLSVNGSFNNRPKGKLLVHDLVKTQSGSTFNNQGHMFLYHMYDQTEVDGTFNNTGCLNDIHNTLPAINNQSIIAKPLTVSPQVNVPIPNALDIGGNPGATVLSWYTAPTGNTIAGSYNNSTNTFTPNSNAAGLSSVYVRTRINTGGVTRRHEVKFDDPVQSLSMDLSDNGFITNQHQNDFEINIYPNPATDYVHIKLKNDDSEDQFQVSLLDYEGRPIGAVDCKYRTNCLLDIPSNTKSGMYYIQVFNAKGGIKQFPIRILK